MIRPTVARVDLTALKSNYRHIVEHLEAEARGRAPRVIAVVKANAYGHGAAQVGLALESAGANRLGFRHDNVRRTLPEVFASPNLELEAVYTHFATADDPESTLFDEQRVRFEDAIRLIAPSAVHSPYIHAANSAALLRDARVWF